MKLSDQERQDFLASYPDWELAGESISKTFQFGNFTESIAFVVRLAFHAEAADHHPDIDIRWNRVALTLSTHDEGALTEKDTGLAAAIEAIAQ